MSYDLIQKCIDRSFGKVAVPIVACRRKSKKRNFYKRILTPRPSFVRRVYGQSTRVSTANVISTRSVKYRTIRSVQMNVSDVNYFDFVFTARGEGSFRLLKKYKLVDD